MIRNICWKTYKNKWSRVSGEIIKAHNAASVVCVITHVSPDVFYSLLRLELEIIFASIYLRTHLKIKPTCCHENVCDITFLKITIYDNLTEVLALTSCLYGTARISVTTVDSQSLSFVVVTHCNVNIYPRASVAASTHLDNPLMDAKGPFRKWLSWGHWLCKVVALDMTSC